ncbi:MAG: DUF2889 domain-containing protein [Deltaproteobacteria bacterium]|nr:DUF2889 domain-containing protein [Deltaproteobacteria bacterium]
MERDCLTLRTIRINTRRTGEREFEAKGNLVDELSAAKECKDCGKHGRQVHNMTVTLRVRHPDFEITSVETELSVYPDAECGNAGPVLQKLVGVRIAGGFTRAVQERIGREKGCTHLVSLVLSMATPIHQAALGVFRPPEPDASHFEPLVGSCLAWRRGGPLHNGVQKGDFPKLETLE